ncbi:MAG TPA: MBL fold metallo-hydrolase [Candidatus Limnocylindria bacterium]|nr:MBL fold metallo-hydrolase [Candidatus Limnocylindria bacterium]
MSLPEQVAPGVRRIALPLPIPALRAVNVYLVEGASEWSLVDTGMHTEEAERALRAALAAMGIAARDVKSAFVTHLHPDHYGMAGLLEREGTSVVMHRPEAERAAGIWAKDGHLIDATYAWFELHGMPPDVNQGMRQGWIAVRGAVEQAEHLALVDDGATFAMDGREMSVQWTPGHTDYHAMLFEPGTGTLFAGDHVLPRITSNIGLYSFSRDDPLGDFTASLERAARMPVKRVLPAHGEPFDDLRGRVDELLVHHRERLERVLELMADDQTAYELSQALFGTLRSPHEERFALAETLAHLRHLERTGRAFPLETRPVRWRRAA